MGSVGIFIVVVLALVFAVAIFYDVKRRRARRFTDGSATRHGTRQDAQGRSDRMGPSGPDPGGGLGL